MPSSNVGDHVDAAVARAGRYFDVLVVHLLEQALDQVLERERVHVEQQLAEAFTDGCLLLLGQGPELLLLIAAEGLLGAHALQVGQPGVGHRVHGALAADETTVKEVVEAAAQGVAESRGAAKGRHAVQILDPLLEDTASPGRTVVGDQC